MEVKRVPLANSGSQVESASQANQQEHPKQPKRKKNLKKGQAGKVEASETKNSAPDEEIPWEEVPLSQQTLASQTVVRILSRRTAPKAATLTKSANSYKRKTEPPPPKNKVNQKY